MQTLLNLIIGFGSILSLLAIAVVVIIPTIQAKKFEQLNKK
jgi:hypothetical protein